MDLVGIGTPEEPNAWGSHLSGAFPWRVGEVRLREEEVQGSRRAKGQQSPDRTSAISLLSDRW